MIDLIYGTKGTTKFAEQKEGFHPQTTFFFIQIKIKMLE